MRFENIVATILVVMSLFFATMMPAAVGAQAYGESTYGDCNYSEGCDDTTPTGGTGSDTDGSGGSGDLSDTGDNQRLLIFGGLILAGAGLVGYSLKRKRAYRLHR